MSRTAERHGGSRHYGKYRGVVLNVDDPMQQGRIQAHVPAVMGSAPSAWAMPCLPFAGMQAGVCFVPPVGSNVWIEFEGGDVNYPIWTGGWHGSASEVPPLALAIPASVPHLVAQTPGQTCLVLSDTPGPMGGILLKVANGAMISITNVGFVMSNGQGATIELTGPEVKVNGHTLTVT